MMHIDNFVQKLEQMMVYIKEYMGKGGESSSNDPLGRSNSHTSSTTYAYEGGTINSTFRMSEQHT